MSFSNYTENKVLGHVFGGVSFSSPSQLHVALFTTAPAEDGTGGVEVSGGSYARVFIAPALGMTVSGTNPTQVANVAAITFPTATAPWGTVVAAGIYDASSSGNLLHSGTLAVSKVVGSDDTFQFAIGQYKITLD